MSGECPGSSDAHARGTSTQQRLSPQRRFAHFHALPCTPQAAGRRVSFHSFYHVLGLDMGFHLERRIGEAGRRAAGQLLNLPHLRLPRLPAMARLTPGLYYFIISTRHPRHKPCCLPAGALSRMLERGARSVAMVFRALVFTFVPTLVELVAVCALLGASFHARVGGLVVATYGAYAAWTVALTRVRGRL